MDDPKTSTNEIRSDGGELAGAVRGRILRLHPLETAGGVVGPVSRRVQGWSSAGDLSSEIIGRWGRFRSADDGQHGPLPFTVAPPARTVRSSSIASGASVAWPQGEFTGGMVSTSIMQRASVTRKTDMSPGPVVQLSGRGKGPGVEAYLQVPQAQQNNTSLPPTTAVTVRTLGRLFDGLGPTLVQRHASFAGLANEDSLNTAVPGHQGRPVTPSKASELVTQRNLIAGEAQSGHVTQSRGPEASEITTQRSASAETRSDPLASMPTVSASAVAASDEGPVTAAKALGLPVVQGDSAQFRTQSVGRGGFLAREVLSRIQPGQAAIASHPGPRTVPSTRLVQTRLSRPTPGETRLSRDTASTGVNARPLPVGGPQPMSQVAVISMKSIASTRPSSVSGGVKPNDRQRGFPLTRRVADSFCGPSAAPGEYAKGGAPHAAAINSWGPIVQRTTGAATFAQSDAAAAPEAAPSTTTATPLAPPASETATSGGVDLLRLADQIYQIIERRLIAEKESRGL